LSVKMSEANLRPRMKAVLEFVREFRADHDYGPSIREIQRGCEFTSTAVTEYQLVKLQELNLIDRDPNIARSIRLCSDR